MADDNNGTPAVPVVARTSAGGEQIHARFKLPAFWPENHDLWFAQVECVLANRNVTREFNKYCLVMEALPHDSLWLVADLIEQVPKADPCTTLKGRLLSAHQLTDFQLAEALFDMLALEGRKPSQLMAAMLEVCLRGAEKCILFPCLFLRRLPRQLRVLLARADLNDLNGLAKQADELWTHHMAEDLVAAVQPPGGWIRASRRPPRENSNRWRRTGSSGASVAAGQVPSTWCGNLMVPGDPAETTGVSIWLRGRTSTPSPT
jgi:hypothetical protein